MLFEDGFVFKGLGADFPRQSKFRRGGFANITGELAYCTTQRTTEPLIEEPEHQHHFIILKNTQHTSSDSFFSTSAISMSYIITCSRQYCYHAGV